jgi:hypothetical protein
MSPSWDETNPPQHPSWKWNENDWQEFLKATDGQIRQFIELYHLLLADPARLDRIAERMGWTIEWQAGEMDEEAEAALPPEEIPYTLHLHPVYTVTRGLFASLYGLCSAFARLDLRNTPHAFNVLTTLHEAEVQALLGIECQDMGDMALTVCHFKRALTHINHALNLLGRASEEGLPGAAAFAAAGRTRIFDLREVWLRVNNEMREEISRRDSSQE